jgi:hypothetical protein
MSGRRSVASVALIAALLALPAASQTTSVPPTAGARPARIGAIDWPAAVGGARRSAGAANVLGRLDQAAINQTRLPILVPADPDLLAGARVYSFGDYYSITTDRPGLGVSFTGTTSVVTLPAKSPMKIDPNVPEMLTVQRTVDGQLASFVRFGVLYTVEVRCDAPSDMRCRNETLVRQLTAAATTVILGQAARQSAGLGS